MLALLEIFIWVAKWKFPRIMNQLKSVFNSIKNDLRSWDMGRFLILREMFTVGWFCLRKWPCVSSMAAILYLTFSKRLEPSFYKLFDLVPGNNNCQHHLIVHLI